jgi:RNA polymerase sigma-70 factor (ECF subfamily)
LNNRLARDVDGAFPLLVQRHVDDLFSGIRRFVATQADAEDLTQETLLRAYRALKSYEPERIEEMQLRSWLWTIALNLCRSAARRRTRRVAEVGLGSAELTAASSDSTELDAVDNATADDWTRRLEQLSNAQRTAVVLRHVVDLPYAEIAAITGRPVGTTKADVHRGIERLRNALEAEAASDQEGLHA